MKYINCPQCGGRLLEGEEGSHVAIKCAKCGTVFEVFIGKEQIEISLRSKQPRETLKQVSA